MRFAAVLLTVLLAALVSGCGRDGKKGEFKNQDKPKRADPKDAGALAGPNKAIV